MKRTLTVTVAMALLAGCGIVPADNHNANGNGAEQEPLVCLQVTEYQDAESFGTFMTELESRGLTAAVLVRDDFVTENCERLQALHQAGHEIMVFVRAESEEGDTILLSTLPREEQEELLASGKTAIEDCLGESPVGFRSTRFDQNEDTYAVLESLGFLYNLSFVARSEGAPEGHEDDTLPYQLPGYSFWAVPMHSTDLGSGPVAFCDKPLSRAIDDTAELGQLLQSELDTMFSQGHPLMLEVHPHYTVPDETIFNAYVDFLDYAVQQGAQFITTAELVDWSQQANSGGE